MTDCPICRQWDIVELGHHCYEREFSKNCDSDGLLLNPGNPDKCLGNGKMRDIECRCDECDHLLKCYSEKETFVDRLLRSATGQKAFEILDELERVEDEYDLKAYEEAMEEFKKNPKTYSHEEVMRMFSDNKKV